MTTVLQKWGNSLALRIPSAYANEIALGPGGYPGHPRSSRYRPHCRRKLRAGGLGRGHQQEKPPRRNRHRAGAGQRSPVKGTALHPRSRRSGLAAIQPAKRPRTGGTQTGVVLSPRAYNQRSRLAIFCPVTSQIKGYPFEVVLPEGLRLSGAVLCDQVKSLDWSTRKVTFAGNFRPVSWKTSWPRSRRSYVNC